MSVSQNSNTVLAVYRTLSEQHVSVRQYSLARPDLIRVHCWGCEWSEMVDAENYRRMYMRIRSRRARRRRPVDPRPLPAQALVMNRFAALDMAREHASMCRGLPRAKWGAK